MDIKKLKAVDGSLPTNGEPEVRYVVVGVRNGSAEPERTIIRLVSRTEVSDLVVKRLGEQHPGLKFSMLATGRLEKCPDTSADFILHRGSDKVWDFDFEGANILRLAFKGKRVRTAAPSPYLPIQQAAH